MQIIHVTRCHTHKSLSPQHIEHAELSYFNETATKQYRDDDRQTDILGSIRHKDIYHIIHLHVYI